MVELLMGIADFLVCEIYQKRVISLIILRQLF